MEKFKTFTDRQIDIRPSDRVIIKEFNNNEIILNEDILSRIFEHTKDKAQALYKVASDAGKMSAKEEDKE